MICSAERRFLRTTLIENLLAFYGLKDSHIDWIRMGGAGQGLYDEIYKSMLGREATEMANDNYLDALQLTALMIRKTKSSFRMFTGCTAEAFIGHLTSYFQQMIERLHSIGGKARVIILDAAKPSDNLNALTIKYPGTLQIAYAISATESAFSHFIVADNMVRIEKPHPRLTAKTLASVIQARVLFNNRGAASVYEAQFDKMFANLKATPK